jgi:hypothetical protein
MTIHRLVLAISIVTAAFILGCGPNTDDASRVPEGAVDTSDPSKVMMGSGPPSGTPKGAQAGPGAAKTEP